MHVYELNLDGLVGPTHNYAGLSSGNIASTSNALKSSNPQAAALQGLEKMRLLYDMGLPQGLLPPQQRPNLKLLHQLGFSGSPSQQISKAHKQAPELLAAAFSASSMWTANAATVTPSSDTEDAKVHFTAANLISNLHRQQESEFTQKILAKIFSNDEFFHHHAPLPGSSATKDEGAANHNRLCETHAHPGVHLFVYGKSPMAHLGPKKYPARQTHTASEAIARKHSLKPHQILFACQNPDAIDQGVFHNDVISLANESVFLVHEQAFVDQQMVFQQLKQKCSFPLSIIELSKSQISIQDAVETYLFNSQLITTAEKSHMVLIAPVECHNNDRVKSCIDDLIADAANPIQQVHFIDLKQSMRNGGGPACLRLRIPLNEREIKSMHQGVLMNKHLFAELETWVVQHYRTELNPVDLADPQLIDESLQALDELTQILQLGSIYSFQSERSL